MTLAALLALSACTATPEPVDGNGPTVAETPVQVVVTGVRPGGGPIRIAVYRNRASFMTREGISNGRSVPAEAERIATTLMLPADSEVAISVFQDLDSDETLDRGFLGIPTEPWGASGSPSALLPPSWDACAIRIGRQSGPIEISLFGSRLEGLDAEGAGR